MKVRFVADTPYDRAKGLMYSQPLANDEIAIFKFDTDSTSGFWNRNVNYGIKVTFFDNNFNIVGIKDLDANQAEIVTSLKPYRYAVEMADTDSDPGKLIEIKNYLEKKYGN